MLTPTEKAQWESKAKTAGVDLNTYIRCCVERRQIPAGQPAINYETVAQLGRVGNNLNQQVKAFNSALKAGQDIPEILESLETVNEIRKLLQEVQAQLLGLEVTSEKPNKLEELRQKE